MDTDGLTRDCAVRVYHLAHQRGIIGELPHAEHQGRRLRSGTIERNEHSLETTLKSKSIRPDHVPAR